MSVALAWLVFVTVGVLVTRAMAPDLDSRTLAFVVLVALAAVVTAALTWLGWWHPLGFARRWRNRWVLLPPLAVVLAPWLGGIQLLDGATLALLVAGYALSGFAEEAVFRGVLFRILRGRRVGRIVVVSSILFGVVHLGNMLIRGNPAMVAAQALGAATSGVGYASLYVLSGSIWAPFLVHFLHDLALNTGRLPVIPVDVAQDVLLVAYGAVLAWRTRAGRTAANPAALDAPHTAAG